MTQTARKKMEKDIEDISNIYYVSSEYIDMYMRFYQAGARAGFDRGVNAVNRFGETNETVDDFLKELGEDEK